LTWFDAPAPSLTWVDAPAPSGQIVNDMRKGSCAIVGNSGLLLKTAYGEMIDQHDVVIRMNLAPTAGECALHYYLLIMLKVNLGVVLHILSRHEAVLSFCRSELGRSTSAS
jgi:hypothetical protein